MSNPIIDSSFPSVLVYGTLGSIVSIATVWLVSVLVYAPICAPVVGFARAVRGSAARGAGRQRCSSSASSG